MTTTSLTIRDIPGPSILNREVDDFNTFEDIPKTKRRFPSNFVLKKSIVSTELPTLQIHLGTTMFRMFYIPSCVAMPDYYIPILVDHFLTGLSIPLDPTFL